MSRREAAGRRRSWAAAAAATVLLATGCQPGQAGPDGTVRVVVSTEILADLVANVGGDRVAVETVVPPGGDPHSYEPTPADAVKVTRADAAFTNHLLLEEHALVKLFDTNVPAGVPNVSLAENAEPYGATLIPLVEDVGLDVLWLGLAVRGDAGAGQRAADVRLTATGLAGPGEFYLYITDTLGVPEVYYNSADGLTEADVVILPPGAHTHLNWAFTEPGSYRLTLAAAIEPIGEPRRELGTGTFTFAVGVDPHTVPVEGVRQVLDQGHADLSVSLETGEVFACVAELSCVDRRGDVPAGQAVIEVPNRALDLVPDDERFGFLGPPGSEVFLLPQAVLGQHVHGQIDPHLWEDVRNAQAYVQVITETLVAVDPAGRTGYEASRDSYLAQLDELHRYLADRIGRIPRAHRNLVTTHDAFGYLANAYGLTVAGFVVPNPAQEPSAAQITRLTETVRNLAVPAVFLEPNLAARTNLLQQVAEDHGVAICKLYGDSFDPAAKTYVDMMRHNADELLRCLGGEQ